MDKELKKLIQEEHINYFGMSFVLGLTSLCFLLYSVYTNLISWLAISIFIMFLSFIFWKRGQLWKKYI